MNGVPHLNLAIHYRKHIIELFKRNRFKSARFVGLFVLSICLMVLDHNTTYLASTRGAMAWFISPLQYMVNWPVTMVDKTSSHLSTRYQLIKTNQALQTQILLLRLRLQHALALEQDNRQLRALLNITTHPVNHVLLADIMSINTGPFVNTVILNQGTHHHVYIGQPVFDANGIMGQVIHVGTQSSTVLLLNDAHSAIPVQIQRNGIRAIATGDGTNHPLKLIQVPDTADVTTGDLLVSSGLGKHFPAGYPVASVIQVNHNPGKTFATILAQPIAALDRGHQVLLVWPQTQQGSHNA